MYKAQIWDHRRERLNQREFSTARMAAENLAHLIAASGTWPEDEATTIARLEAGEVLHHGTRSYKVLEDA